MDRGHIGFTTGCLASTISHMRIAAKSGKAIENYLGVSRALASPLGLTCRKMCPSVFLPMIAYAMHRAGFVPAAETEVATGGEAP